MKRASVGVRAVLWLNEEWGLDANHQHRCRIAKRLNAMVKAEVSKERRRCARLCEIHANQYEARIGDDGMGPSAQIRTLRAKILNGEKP